MKAVFLERGGGQFVLNTCACHVRVCRDGPYRHFLSFNLSFRVEVAMRAP